MVSASVHHPGKHTTGHPRSRIATRLGLVAHQSPARTKLRKLNVRPREKFVKATHWKCASSFVRLRASPLPDEGASTSSSSIVSWTAGLSRYWTSSPHPKQRGCSFQIESLRKALTASMFGGFNAGERSDICRSSMNPLRYCLPGMPAGEVKSPITRSR